MTEVRLQAGMVQVAPVYIGARQRADIVRITESPEMDPWRLGVTYDRPIPRRIAESAGVPRGLFGQVKMASVVEFAAPRVPFGSELRREYFEFLVANGLRTRFQTRLFPIVHFVNSLLHFASPHRYRWIYFLQRAVSKVLGREWSWAKRWRDIDGAIFCFAVNKRIGDYLIALRGIVSFGSRVPPPRRASTRRSPRGRQEGLESSQRRMSISRNIAIARAWHTRARSSLPASACRRALPRWQ
jgi:hypothetical protein